MPSSFSFWPFGLLLLLACMPRPLLVQNAICPIGFVWGGLCVTAPCPPSLPPFHCLLGSCCRDQRPLFARLGPIVYPQQLTGGAGIGTGLRCFDSALNCYMYLPYCFISIYRVCMVTHCPRTCGYCGLGALGLGGGLNGLTGGLGGFGGLGAAGSFGGLNGLNGLGGLNGIG